MGEVHNLPVYVELLSVSHYGIRFKIWQYLVFFEEAVMEM